MPIESVCVHVTRAQIQSELLTHYAKLTVYQNHNKLMLNKQAYHKLIVILYERDVLPLPFTAYTISAKKTYGVFSESFEVST